MTSEVTDFRARVHTATALIQQRQAEEAQARTALRAAIAARKEAQAALQALVEADSRPLPLFDRVEKGKKRAGSRKPSPPTVAQAEEQIAQFMANAPMVEANMKAADEADHEWEEAERKKEVGT